MTGSGGERDRPPTGPGEARRKIINVKTEIRNYLKFTVEFIVIYFFHSTMNFLHVTSKVERRFISLLEHVKMCCVLQYPKRMPSLGILALESSLAQHLDFHKITDSFAN